MLFGHQKIWNFFIDPKLILSHAYLFSGVEKIGKKRMALEIVKFLNCNNLQDNLSGETYKKYPCLKCKNCLDIEKNQFPDLFILEKGKDKKDIEIDQIRDLKKFLSFKPYNSKFKIAIIDNAHLMNISSQNALLKTLEEPLGRALIFLITDKPRQLLETILSRVQEIKFFNPSKKEIQNYLKDIKILEKISEEIKKDIEKFSFGRPGLVVDFINNPKKLTNYKNKIEELKTIINSPLYIRFDYVKKISEKEDKEDKEDKKDESLLLPLLEILILWSIFFQDLLLTDKIERKKVREILEKIDKTYFLISTTNVNKKLALENLVMEF